jgi:hypothetical protein
LRNQTWKYFIVALVGKKKHIVKQNENEKPERVVTIEEEPSLATMVCFKIKAT